MKEMNFLPYSNYSWTGGTESLRLESEYAHENVSNVGEKQGYKIREPELSKRVMLPV